MTAQKDVGIVRETGRVGTDEAATVQSVRADDGAVLTVKATKKKPGAWSDDPAKAGTFDEEADTWEDEEPVRHANGQAVQ